MADKFGLATSDLEKLKNIFNKNKFIEKVIIYGSRAIGNYRIGSDIDISLIAPKLTLTDLLKIENEIDDLYLPYKIDLSLLHQIENKDLIEHIKRCGIEFY